MVAPKTTAMIRYALREKCEGLAWWNLMEDKRDTYVVSHEHQHEEEREEDSYAIHSRT